MSKIAKRPKWGVSFPEQPEHLYSKFWCQRQELYKILLLKKSIMIKYYILSEICLKNLSLRRSCDRPLGLMKFHWIYLFWHHFGALLIWTSVSNKYLWFSFIFMTKDNSVIYYWAEYALYRNTTRTLIILFLHTKHELELSLIYYQCQILSSTKKMQSLQQHSHTSDSKH